MIEFLPPRRDAFGGGHGVDDARDVDDDVWGEPDTDGDDRPLRPRWLGALAATGVIALIAAGVVVASPWSDADTSSSPTTTAAGVGTTEPTPSTRPEPVSIVDQVTGLPVDTRGWVIDDTSRFRIVDAGSASTTARPLRDPIDLWHDDTFGRTSGTWLVISGDDGSAPLRRDGVEVVLGAAPDVRRGVLAVDDDGITTLDVTAAGLSLTITSFGVDQADLAAIGAVVTIEPDPAGPAGRMRIDVHGLDDGDGPLAPLAREWLFDRDGPVATDHLGLVRAHTSFYEPATGRWAEARVVEIDVLERMVNDLAFTRPLRPGEMTGDARRRLDDLADGGRPVDVVVSRRSGTPMVEIGLRDGSTLVLVGQHDLVDLLDLAVQLRPTDADRWRQLLLDVRDRATGPIGPPPPVAAVDLGGGERWGAWVSDGWFGIGSVTAFVSERWSDVAEPRLVTYRGVDEQYLLAVTVDGAARTITVVQDGLEPQQVPLLAVPGTPNRAAVVAVDPSRSVAVTWSDGDGRPVDGPREVPTGLGTSDASAASGTVPP